MGNEDRQQKINKLKTLRAELMAYKEFQEGENGEGNTENSAMASCKKTYIEDNKSMTTKNMNDYDVSGRAAWAQYEQTFDEEKINRKEKRRR